MSRSTNAENYFQSDANLNESDRKERKSHNTSGNPIKLPSKLNAVTPDPLNHDAVYVAESAGTIKRVDLTTRTTTHTYRGSGEGVGGPLTSVCVTPDNARVFAGGWDTQIRCWDAATTKFQATISGHTDFIKCLTYLPGPGGHDLLISGGAEGDVRIWYAREGAESLYACRSVLQTKGRAIQDIVIDPFHEPTRLFCASSDPQIRLFLTGSDSDPKIRQVGQQTIDAHATSVYRLRFDDSGDVWTASADKTAKHLIRGDETEEKWTVEMTLEHPDYVRDIVIHPHLGWVMTACRDEEIRVWDTASGKLLHTFSGHFEEIMGLCLVGKRQDRLLSVSLDGTVRQWDLKDIGKPPKDDAAQVKTNAEGALKDRAVGESGLTEEEERELNELMEDGERESNSKAIGESGLTEEEERELNELMENEQREVQDRMADGLQ